MAMFSPQRERNVELLAIQNLTLLQMGVDIKTPKGGVLLKNYWKFFSLISCVVYLEFGLINFVAHSGFTDLDKASGALSVFNQGCLILFKMATLLVKGDKFLKLISDIILLAQKANCHENKKWLSENARAQQVGKVYFYVCWVAVGCCSIFPLLLMGYDYKRNKGFNHKLPFGGKFPHEGGLTLFIINYILSLIYIYGLLNMLVGLDTLFGWFIHSISAHFRILRCKVENLALKLQNGDCSNFAEEMGSIVHYHKRTLEFVRELNNIFREILWAEVLLSSLQMCFVIYTLNNDDNVFNMPFNFMTLVILTIQLMIYCFGGEKIKTESLMLSLDIYLHFPWHSMTIKEKKLMLLPLMRSQRLSVLRGFFFEVDRNLLVYILKTSFSVNALLSAMKE